MATTTTSGKTNGKLSSADATGEKQIHAGSKTSVEVITSSIESIGGPLSALEPQDLYSYYSPTSGRFESGSELLNVSQNVAQVIDLIDSAHKEEDPLQRENFLALAVDAFVQLRQFLGKWTAFDDAYVVIINALASHRKKPFTPKDSLAFRKACDILRRSPMPTDDTLQIIVETLELSDFDTCAPMNGLDVDK